MSLCACTYPVQGPARGRALSTALRRSAWCTTWRPGRAFLAGHAVQADTLTARAGKRLAELRWADAAAGGLEVLAFDHQPLVEAAVQALRTDVDTLRFPPGLMSEPFSLGYLQTTCETVLGRALDKSRIRRRLDAAGCVQPVEGAMKTGAFRPAQLYQVPADGR